MPFCPGSSGLAAPAPTANQRVRPSLGRSDEGSRTLVGFARDRSGPFLGLAPEFVPWNVFQFKSEDVDGVSQPMWALNVAHDDATGSMSFYLFSPFNTPSSHEPVAAHRVPVGRWLHVEALYEASAEDEGRVVFWLDGQRILDVSNVQTVRPGGPERAVWGIGNYTDHIAGGDEDGTATLFFDDATVSTARTYGTDPSVCPAT